MATLVDISDARNQVDAYAAQVKADTMKQIQDARQQAFDAVADDRQALIAKDRDLSSREFVATNRAEAFTSVEPTDALTGAPQAPKQTGWGFKELAIAGVATFFLLGGFKHGFFR